MKPLHVILLVLFVLVVLMVRDAKKTTAELVTGERAAADVGGAVMSGFFTSRSKKNAP